MTMTVAMPSSSSSSRRGGLRGPRPLPLKVTSSSASKPPKKSAAPVIVYEHTPKVVHARPQEFMTVVQRLTGKPPVSSSSSSPPLMMPATSSVYAPAMVEEGAAAACGGDPLLLTLGQRQAVPAPVQPPAMPSPMTAAGMLQSPGFIFSPNTMQSIQELSPLF
ncbi:hypothetical protein E2562_013004 [Oryza meyeriana var. granulata]|uniref:VQ domain-containing protein n=1 Tax=Oryza meyeriana var. granulata TaxID=110450 RepID=A0A6G1DHN2_9ORYZ|nr:hypothetical protein E2562_013004 [Oryza meyeriana var. granulata]